MTQTLNRDDIIEQYKLARIEEGNRFSRDTGVKFDHICRVAVAAELEQIVRAFQFVVVMIRHALAGKGPAQRSNIQLVFIEINKRIVWIVGES